MKNTKKHAARPTVAALKLQAITLLSIGFLTACSPPEMLRSAFLNGSSGEGDNLIGISPVPAPPGQAPISTANIRLSNSTLLLGDALHVDALQSAGLSRDSLVDWNFGDGSPSERGPVQAHIYDAAGQYEVGLKITTSAGDELTARSIITVQEFNPPNHYQIYVSSNGSASASASSAENPSNINSAFLFIPALQASLQAANGGVAYISLHLRRGDTFQLTTPMVLNGRGRVTLDSYLPAGQTNLPDPIVMASAALGGSNIISGSQDGLVVRKIKFNSNTSISHTTLATTGTAPHSIFKVVGNDHVYHYVQIYNAMNGVIGQTANSTTGSTGQSATNYQRVMFDHCAFREIWLAGITGVGATDLAIKNSIFSFSQLPAMTLAEINRGVIAGNSLIEAGFSDGAGIRLTSPYLALGDTDFAHQDVSIQDNSIRNSIVDIMIESPVKDRNISVVRNFGYHQQSITPIPLLNSNISIQFKGAHFENITVQNNTMSSIGNAEFVGIYFNTSTASGINSDVVIRHNTYFSDAQRPLFLYFKGQPVSLGVNHNIIRATGAITAGVEFTNPPGAKPGAIVLPNVNDATLRAELTDGDSIYSFPANFTVWYYSLIGGRVQNRWFLDLGKGQNILITNPLFLDELQFNYSLTAGSPAINLGSSGPVPRDDATRGLRDARPDAGAFEAR